MKALYVAAGAALIGLALYNGTTGGLQLAKVGDFNLTTVGPLGISAYDVVFYLVGGVMLAVGLSG